MLLQQPSTIRRMVRFKILDADGNPQPDFQAFKGKNEDQIVRSIVGRISVSERGRTEIVDISVRGTNPKVLHKVVNALVDTFIDMQTSNLRRNRQRIVQNLETKAQDARLKMEREEEERKRFFQQHNIESEMFSARFEENQEQRTRYLQRLDEIQLQLIDLEPTYEAVRAAIEADAEDWVTRLENDPYVRNDVNLGQLEREILQRKADRGLMADKGRGAKEVVELETEIKRLELVYRLEMENLLRSVPDLVKGLQTREASLRKKIEAIERQYEEFAELKVRFEEYNSRIERYRTQAKEFFDMLAQLYTGEDAEEETVRRVEHATEPKKPVSPKVALNIGLAVLLSFLVGLGVVLLLEYVDDTIMSKDEVERLGRDIPFLGVIRNIRPAGGARQEGSGSRPFTRVRDLFAVEQPKSTVAEDFRGVRTALSFGGGLDDDRIFLVTSSSPKEGKTTVTINLATVMAYSGLRTLLIDADLRKPRIHKSFGISNEFGLTNVIIGSGESSEFIRPASLEGLEKLDLLTSGPIPPNPSELLGYPKVEKFLRGLVAQYDRILIDSPPLGAVTDAAVLGRIVDRTILVVKAGKTRRRLIENSLEQLRTVSAKFAGVVVNDLRSTATRYYPSYYQYYYYSSYEADETRKKKGA
jgi:succinoglycan biosynthesis transport protein ExoP